MTNKTRKNTAVRIRAASTAPGLACIISASLVGLREAYHLFYRLSIKNFCSSEKFRVHFQQAGEVFPKRKRGVLGSSHGLTGIFVLHEGSCFWAFIEIVSNRN